MKLLLVGAGYMAREYAKVLLDMQINFTVVGRSDQSCYEFEKQFPSVKVLSGGIEKFENVSSFDLAIVATSIESLAENTEYLLRNGINNILVEKPGGLDCEEIAALAKVTELLNSTVILGYNRRFYSSVIRAMQIIQEDGGVLSFNFEFTEWSHLVEPQKIDLRIKNNWFLANSTHVVDLAFFLGGIPNEISTFVSGGLHWHPSASIFAGAGKTTRNALFSYNANWNSAGRWGVEVLTKSHKLILRPLEKLQVQNIGSIEISHVPLEDELDIKFKPGLFLQTKAFIERDLSKTCSIQEQKHMMSEVYTRLANYNNTN